MPERKYEEFGGLEVDLYVTGRRVKGDSSRSHM